MHIAIRNFLLPFLLALTSLMPAQVSQQPLQTWVPLCGVGCVVKVVSVSGGPLKLKIGGAGTPFTYTAPLTGPLAHTLYVLADGHDYAFEWTDGGVGPTFRSIFSHAGVYTRLAGAN